MQLFGIQRLREIQIQLDSYPAWKRIDIKNGNLFKTAPPVKQMRTTTNVDLPLRMCILRPVEYAAQSNTVTETYNEYLSSVCQ